MPTLRDNLETFAQSFETARRQPDGDTFVKLTEDAPDWIDMQAIHSALDAGLPDDWIYAAASAVADDLPNYDGDEPQDFDDAVHEIADGLTDIYTASLASWYASASWAREITEEAVADLGNVGQTIEQRMQYGQYCAYQRIAYAILEQCEDAATDDDEFEDLDDLLDALRCDEFNERELGSLPTFGGPDVQDTSLVWSWDVDRVLVGTCSADYRVIRRADLDEWRAGIGVDDAPAVR